MPTMPTHVSNPRYHQVQRQQANRCPSRAPHALFPSLDFESTAARHSAARTAAPRHYTALPPLHPYPFYRRRRQSSWASSSATFPPATGNNEPNQFSVERRRAPPLFALCCYFFLTRLSLDCCVKSKMRKLKFHEQKLLKRHNFLEYKREGGHREALVTQRYRLVERDDYKKYNGICLMVQKLVNIIKQMDPRDPFRIQMTDMILDKLYNMGVISTKESLLKCEKLSVSAFCRRRLATVMVKLKFAEHLKEAVTYIEQGHVRVGPQTVTDPAFLVTRNMEDFITWVDSSKIKRKVMEYNDALDDYDAMF